MNYKLGRAKRTPSTILAEREHNWRRAIATLSMRRVKSIDIWWCRKFLEGIIANPLVYTAKKILDEGPSAKRYLAELNDKYPQ